MATGSTSTCACTRSPSKREWIRRLCPSAPPYVGDLDRAGARANAHDPTALRPGQPDYPLPPPPGRYGGGVSSNACTSGPISPSRFSRVGRPRTNGKS
jgi:hypothetical protein